MMNANALLVSCDDSLIDSVQNATAEVSGCNLAVSPSSTDALSHLTGLDVAVLVVHVRVYPEINAQKLRGFMVANSARKRELRWFCRKTTNSTTSAGHANHCKTSGMISG